MRIERGEYWFRGEFHFTNHNALLFCTIGTIILGIVGYTFGLSFFGMVVGLLFGLFSPAGLACYQHYFILRIVLWGYGYMPWNYAQFMNYGTELTFLQKVGGGYIFIHRYDRFHLLRYSADSWVGFCLITSVLLLEMRFRGTILHQMGHYANKMLGIIRQPVVWQWQRISRKTLVVLVVLVVLWIAVLVWQQQQGILTWDSVGYAMRLISVFIILPLMIGIGLIRSRFWKV